MWNIVILTLANIAVQFVLYYLNRNNNKQKNKPPSKDQYSAPTADQTRPVPKYWGTVKLNSPNVVAWQITDQERIIQKQKTLFGTEKIETPNFKTYVDMHLALGLTDGGNGATLKQIIVNDEVVFQNNSQGDIMLGQINKPNLFGEDNGISGTFDFYSGKDGQVKSQYLNNRLYDGYAPKWKKLSYVVLRDFWVAVTNGTAGSIPYFSFVLQHLPVPYWTTAQYAIINGQECNPAVVIYYILTDDMAGATINPSKIDLNNFYNIAVKLKNENIGISLLRQEQTPAIDDIGDILATIDGNFYTDLNTGLMTLSINRQDYNIDDLDVISLNKEIKSYASSRTSLTTAVSEVKIEFTDINNNFISDYAIFRNEATRLKRFKGESKIFNYPMICNAETANKIATREAIPLTTSLIQLSLETDRSLSTKVPGDVVRVNIDKLGIKDVVFRISKIGYGKLKADSLKIEMLQDKFGVESAVFSSKPPRPPIVNNNEALNCNLKVMTAPAFFLLNRDVSNNMILTYTERPNSKHQFYEIYTKRSGFDYLNNGISEGFTYKADLINAITVQSNTLVVSSNNLRLQNANSDQLNAGYNLTLIIDESTGIHEFVNFSSFSYNELTGQYTININSRGLLDSIPREFSNSSKVYFISYGYGINQNEYFNDNEQIRIKALTRTNADILTLNEAAEIIYTVNNRAKRPINVSNLKVNNINYNSNQTIGNTDLELSWSFRNKIATVQDYLIDNVNNTDGNTTEIRLYNNVGGLIKSVSVSGNQNSWVFSDELAINDGNRYNYIKAVIFTKNSNLESQEQYDIIINRV